MSILSKTTTIQCDWCGKVETGTDHYSQGWADNLPQLSMPQTGVLNALTFGGHRDYCGECRAIVTTAQAEVDRLLAARKKKP